MAKSFASGAAFKTSLEARLKALASQRNVPLNTLRLKLIIERLLARLFLRPNPPWLLKGGYAMELRYRPKARTTRDIDLTVSAFDTSAALKKRLEELRDELQQVADADLSDYFAFRIESPKIELQGAPGGGARFPCEAFLAGKTYGRFPIDIGFGDDVGAAPERLVGDDLLAFAGVPPANVLAIPKTQQFAEKLHAYTFPWKDRENTRTKDLIDMVMLIETGEITPAETRAAVFSTFTRRGKHTAPDELLPPPRDWVKEFTALSKEASLSTTDLSEAFTILSRFYQTLR
jgi:nucleotidyltransferase AbiEii toxin of type IV toxin-antitoxin system